MKKSNKAKKKKKPFMKFLKITTLTLVSVLVLSLVAFSGVVLAIINTAPDLDIAQISSLNETSKIYDSTGQFMDNVVTDELRTSISIKEIPENLKNAFISIEDERFKTHNGIDLKRIAGVVYLDVKNKLTGKSGVQGASTITQQLIKNTLLTNEVTLKRKLQEMHLAMELEKTLTKDQILEAYLNTIFLGGKANGVEAAAEQYFNKHAKDLDLIQCAFIGGVTQNPTKFYPFTFKDNKLTVKQDLTPLITRTKLVLNSMYENNCITKEQLDKAVDELNKKGIAFTLPTSYSNRLNYEWFSLPAIEQVKADLKAQYKYSDKEINTILMYNGLKIYTTMDKNLQDAAQKVIDDGKNIVIRETDKNGVIQPQASAVVMDYHNGEVKVIIGGRGQQPARSFNRAAYNGAKEFNKPTGSAIKPLTVYAPAIDTKIATAGTVIEDSPLSPDLGKLYPQADGKPWDPQNYDSNINGFSGYMPLRLALTHSVNLVAIKLEFELGLKTGYSYAEKFGITNLDKKQDYISALALGELSKGTNTLTMAAAFGTFGNNGLYTAPRLYRKVVDRNGKVLLETKPVNTKILTPQSSYLMYNLLKGPVQGSLGESGTAGRAKFGSMPVSGKTGTSSGQKNFWFSGLTPYYSGAVWIGDDIPREYGSGQISSGTSASVWGKIMAEAHKNLPVKDIEEAPGITTATICRDSGLLPTEACKKDPRGDRTYTEYFIEGTVPSTFCDTHVEAKINKNNGKLATEFTPIDLIISRVYIKRNYIPTKPIADQQYVLPTEQDDTKPSNPFTPVIPVIPTHP